MRPITPGQVKAIHAIAGARAWTDQEYRERISLYNGVTTSKDMSYLDADDFIKRFGTRPDYHNRYAGRGSKMKPNGHLTQAQADEIARLENKLKMTDNPHRLRGLIVRVFTKNCTPDMLMNYEAGRLIMVMQKMTKERK